MLAIDFLIIYFLFYCAALFLWYITHFSCRWFHQWRRLWSTLVKVVQVASKAWCWRKVGTQNVSRMKTGRKVFHWCHTWEIISTSQHKNKQQKQKQSSRCSAEHCVRLSAVASWNENHGSRRVELCVVCLCVCLKPYCNISSIFFNNETKVAILVCLLGPSRTLTRLVLNHPIDCINIPQAPKNFISCSYSHSSYASSLNSPFSSSWNWNIMRRTHGHFYFHLITLRAQPSFHFSKVSPRVISLVNTMVL